MRTLDLVLIGGVVGFVAVAVYKWIQMPADMTVPVDTGVMFGPPAPEGVLS